MSTLAEQFIEEQLLQVAQDQLSGRYRYGDGVYERIRGAMDKALLDRLAKDLRGNQSKMADCLGLNRSTVRKRCKTLRVNL